MRPERPWVKPDACDPLRYEARILAGRHAGVGTTTTRKQELTGSLAGGLYIIIDGLAGLLAQFKSDGLPSFLLSNGCTIRRVTAGSYILDPDGNDITAAKLAVDRQIEHSKVTRSALNH